MVGGDWSPSVLVIGIASQFGSKGKIQTYVILTLCVFKLEDLTAYQVASQYRRTIQPIIRSLPKHELYELGMQMRRASRSPAANVAEGYGRYHYQENIQFCRIARASLNEMKAHLNCALEEKYISQETYEYLYSETEKTSKIINGYISFLKKERARKK
ncbi:MAG: four helix bundle protein [Saprospiraceae bacterium]|nr:four helix bundle protein [Saprospiraceae bacterium]